MSEIVPIDSYPIPFDRDEIMRMQEESLEQEFGGLVSEGDMVESVDAFHEKYIDELTRTDEWVFFRCGWGGGCNYVYVWNHMSGYGFKFDSDWEVACSLIEAWSEFTDEFSSEDFEPSHYPWELP